MFVHKWHKSTEALPPIGHDVLVFRREEFDIKAIAHLEEGDDGEAYWDSADDIVHGAPEDYITHWAELPPPPTE